MLPTTKKFLTAETDVSTYQLHQELVQSIQEYHQKDQHTHADTHSHFQALIAKISHLVTQPGYILCRAPAYWDSVGSMEYAPGFNISIKPTELKAAKERLEAAYASSVFGRCGIAPFTAKKFVDGNPTIDLTHFYDALELDGEQRKNLFRHVRMDDKYICQFVINGEVLGSGESVSTALEAENRAQFAALETISNHPFYFTKLMIPIRQVAREAENQANKILNQFFACFSLRRLSTRLQAEAWDRFRVTLLVMPVEVVRRPFYTLGTKRKHEEQKPADLPIQIGEGVGVRKDIAANQAMLRALETFRSEIQKPLAIYKKELYQYGIANLAPNLTKILQGLVSMPAVLSQLIAEYALIKEEDVKYRTFRL